jgi:Ran-binding protein 1
MRARLYRWRNDEWKERGTGELKLLRHKNTKKIRCILRQDKTLKPACNFLVVEDPLCNLKEHQGSDKMFFFTAYDCSDETYQVEKFVLKFGNADSKINFLTFKMLLNSKQLLTMQKNLTRLLKLEEN